MEHIYWVEEWAKVRENEVVRLPESFKVHESFLENISKADFETAFREIWNIYISIYRDIANSPETFGMPLYKIEQYNSFTSQARDSRKAAYRPFNLLYNLLVSGSFQNGDFLIDINNFKSINKIKNTYILFEKLGDYGFYFEGLKNYKISDKDILMFYSNNDNVMPVFKLMAEKARITNRLIDFLSCHYKLFQDDLNTANYGTGADIVADKMHTREEQEFIYEMDAVLRGMGYCAEPKIWNEGPGYAYYDKESVMKSNGPYHYMMLSWKTELILFLRIRNASACLDYLKNCPATVKQIFLRGDSGCKNRYNNTCKFGQEYTIDGNHYWRCGCCNAPFYFSPIKDDIPHYIKLVELGFKK